MLPHGAVVRAAQGVQLRLKKGSPHLEKTAEEQQKLDWHAVGFGEILFTRLLQNGAKPRRNALQSVQKNTRKIPKRGQRRGNGTKPRKNHVQETAHRRIFRRTIRFFTVFTLCHKKTPLRVETKKVTNCNEYIITVFWVFVKSFCRSVPQVSGKKLKKL